MDAPEGCLRTRKDSQSPPELPVHTTPLVLRTFWREPSRFPDEVTNTHDSVTEYIVCYARDWHCEAMQSSSARSPMELCKFGEIMSVVTFSKNVTSCRNGMPKCQVS
jgi:hypothetical protein